MKTGTEADVPELLASAPDTSLSASCALIAPSAVALERPPDNRRRPCRSMLTAHHKLPGSGQTPITQVPMLSRITPSNVVLRYFINLQGDLILAVKVQWEACGRLGDLRGTWASHIRSATSASTKAMLLSPKKPF